jgi:hypothetical protein
VRRPLLLVLGILTALGPGWSSAADDPFRYRGDLREEVSATGQSDTAFDPEGRIFAPDEVANRLRLSGEFSLKMGERWSLKAKGVADTLVGRDPRLQATHVDSDLAVRDLYLNGSLGRFQLSAGRKILRWSNGYAFSPAGILDPVRDPADPQDRLGRSQGRDLVQLDYYQGGQTLTVALASPTRLWGRPVGDQGIVAVRYHVVLKSLELAASAGFRPTAKDTGALGFNYTVGDHVGIHGEVAASRGTDALYPRSILRENRATLFGSDFTAPLRQKERAASLRYLLGLNYTFGNGLNVIAEYYHNDEGLTSGEWSNFTAQAAYSRTLFETGSFPPVHEGRSLPELNVLQAMQVLRGGSVRRNYFFLRGARTQLQGRLQVNALALVGLDDRSLVVSPEISFSPASRILVYGRGTLFGGGRWTEYGSVPTGRAVSLGVVISF